MGKVQFLSATLLFLLYISCLFCSSILLLLPSFMLNNYLLVYYFNYLVISFTTYLLTYFLGSYPGGSVCMGATINISVYNSVVWINTNLISIVHKSPPPLCSYSHKLYLYAFCSHQHRFMLYRVV